ncbi:MAG TPA: hypothetical protein VFZ17_11400 [Acidimicrobiia bacterium]|nr:hypothetical protein [Acidimicrobiia bacterium]
MSEPSQHDPGKYRLRRRWKRLRGPDGLHALRRYAEQRADQLLTVAWHRYGPPVRVAPFDGDPRLALVTVNFSTTRYLKLMLCTLGEQSARWFVRHLVVVDNASRDGGPEFLRALEARVPRLHLVERRHFLSHAQGMRAGLRALATVERAEPTAERTNVVVGCDTDVVFRDDDALLGVSAQLAAMGGVFLGEARVAPTSPYPDMQASFFAFRRDAAARRDVHPLVNHGSPAFDMQVSMVRAGLTLVDFPLHKGGYLLHRGRSGAAAAGTHHPRHSYARVTTTQPHYMGVPDGARLWAAIEDRWAPLLEPAAEASLIDHLAERFAVFGQNEAP